MDPLPLIPENFSNHDVCYSLRGAFQEYLDGRNYPADIARNIIRNDVDEELQLKPNATEVLQVYSNFEGTLERIQNAENDVMVQSGHFFIKKDEIRRCFELREQLKLKSCDLFKALEKDFADEFGLIQASDLSPDMIRQYLDFRYNPSIKSHICEGCSKIKESDNLNQKKKSKRTITTEPQIKKDEKIGVSCKIIPSTITFHNYEIGQVYTKKLKIINTSSLLQAVSLKTLPRKSYFSVILDQNSKIAPGISVSATIFFKPEIYINSSDEVIFKTCSGESFVLHLKCSRDGPRLITYVFKSNGIHPSDRYPPSVKENFMEKRQEALNSTIDCGCCLVSQYVLLSLLVENKGMPGKFFIITEEEWFLLQIETVSSNMEFTMGEFWIYPTHFEIGTGEIIEVNAIFQPTRPGLHLETLFVICDNNSFQQLEIVGDAVEFSEKFIIIDVPPEDTDISKFDDYCIYFGHIENKTLKNFNVVVHNKSSLYLNCVWKFRNKYRKGVHDLNATWIRQKNDTSILNPYSTTEFEFEIFLDAIIHGYHNTFFSFFILNIPLASLKENEEITIIERDNISGKSLSKAADVQITEFEIACFIDFSTDCEVIPQKSESFEPPLRQQKLVFSDSFLSFGIIPTGLDIQKELLVQSITDEEVYWKILEIRYNLDTLPHIVRLQEENLSCTSGNFVHKGQKSPVHYIIRNKAPLSWVSILVLISMNNKEETSVIESICVVTYEIIDYAIVIKTGHATGPILCPLKINYVDIPVDMSFTIENRSPITGCFYFLKPTGRDSTKISLEFQPNSSVLKPFETMTVTVKMCCSEIGIFENIFVPCFIGMGQEPIILRVLCAVDGVHVCFYLPVEGGNEFKKIIWPPKVVYEYDYDWGFCPCEQENCFEYQTNVDELCAKTTRESSNASSDYSSTSKNSSVNDTVNSVSSLKRLEQILRDRFKDDLFLQEEIVEVHDIPLRSPRKVTFYIENITPITTKYTTQAQNFSGDINSEYSIVNVKMKKNNDIWDDLMGNEYGILVQPELEKGQLADFGSTAIHIWIYANTHGIYSEEITIDIPEIPAFSFSLLIEVIGSPIVLPMALNSLTECPIIRFGSIPYNAKSSKRRIRICNTSCVPLHIVWHTFMKDYSHNCDEYKMHLDFEVVDADYNPEKGKLILFDECLGDYTDQVCGVESKEIDIKENSSSFIEIYLRPEHFNSRDMRTDITCNIIGHIYMKECYRSKLNYFYRKTGPELHQIRMEAKATLEMPTLSLDLMYGKSELIIYANDVIFKRIYVHYVRMVFRNHNQSICEAVLTTQEPFSIKNPKNEMIKEKKITLDSLGFEEVIINCYMDHQKILALSSMVYDESGGENDDKYDLAPIVNDKVSIYNTEIYCADKENKMLHIRKMVQMQYAHVRESIPIDMYIYFPNIMAKPSIVKFENVLLNTTRKTLISVYNLTGCPVKFEIYKSSTAHAFYVTPHFGEIGKSTGPNKQFVDIFIYFTPTECKAYQESIRIVTNIPNYYIEVPIKGTGFRIYYDSVSKSLYPRG